jgi:flavin reductase (DIM6/NTAB) family NADH-FMN oxidoreductase RutF
MTDSDSIEFRTTLGNFATGVTVVTMHDGDEVHGITVNSFASASLHPPLVSFFIDKGAHAHDLLLAGERFAVSILRSSQQDISDLFAGRPVPVDEPLASEHGVPVVRDALAWIICKLHGTAEAGDHTLFLGSVEHTFHDREGEPLLYFRGGYGLKRP